MLVVFPFTFSVDYKTKSGSLDDDLVSNPLPLHKQIIVLMAVFSVTYSTW